MRISECETKIKELSMEFFKNNNVTMDTMFGYNEHFNLMMKQPDDSELIFDCVLLGSKEEDSTTFQWPFNPDNPSYVNLDMDKILSLKEFGKRIGIPEFTEQIISFDPLATMMSQPMRRMSPPQVHKNSYGNIESCYTLEELLSVAAIYHKCKAIKAVNSSGYIIYLGILDDKPISGNGDE
jgi:hypothetical protein